jgi:hypothetical protein
VLRHAPRHAGHPLVIVLSTQRNPHVSFVTIPNADIGILVYVELSGAALMENNILKSGLTVLGLPSTQYASFIVKLACEL